MQEAVAVAMRTRLGRKKITVNNQGKNAADFPPRTFLFCVRFH